MSRIEVFLPDAYSLPSENAKIIIITIKQKTTNHNNNNNNRIIINV